MLRSVENLLGYEIAATNGSMGTVSDFLFLDDEWTVPYVVVSAGGWLNRRRVVLSTTLVRDIVDANREFRVGLTRELVYASPNVETERPVTRQNEILLARHYGWLPYWTPDPFLGVDLPAERLEVHEELAGSNPHLRSFREITAYAIEPVESIGYVTDAVTNDADWRISGLVVAKSRGQRGDEVLIDTRRVEEIDWTHRIVRINTDGGAHTRFNANAAVNPRHVVEHYDYLGRLHHETLIPESTERTIGDATNA